MKFFTILFILCFIFCSVGLVSAADINDSSSDYVIKVSHDDVKRGSNVNFTIDVRQNGSAVSDADVNIYIRPMNDPDPNYIALQCFGKTDSDGKFRFSWNIDPAQFLDMYRLDVNVWSVNGDGGIDEASYQKYFNITASPSLNVKIGKSSLFLGEKTKIQVYLRLDGKDMGKFGEVKMIVSGKTYYMNYKDGAYFINYNSQIIGNNLLSFVYVPINASGFNNIQSITVKKTIKIKATPDLVISKIMRSGNKYKVHVYNIGSGASSISKLKIWYSNNKYKVINVPSLGVGKSKILTINFFKYNTHRKYKKYAQINYNKGIYENNYTNNKLTFKSNMVYGFCPDLKVTKVKRSGNNYIVIVKNIGNIPASAFKIQLWYGSKIKIKGLITSTVKKFGQLGNKLPSGISIGLTIPYYPYKKHYKYYKFVSINYDKKVIESSYANNLFKFKA